MRYTSSPADSQESYWSNYTTGSYSTQSSQEECPDVGGIQTDPMLDYTAYHRVLELASCVELREPGRYK